MKVQLYIDPENRLSKVPYQVPNNIHYVRYQDYLDVQTQPDALTAYLYAAELAKDDIKKLKAEVERLRKAGDALEQELIGCYFEQDDPADSESLRAWRAAKEGNEPEA